MEFVKHHVTASGNTSLRGFFGSDAVDFDPPSLSLRQNIMKAKAKAVYDLASGYTDDDDEDAIKDLMVKSENSYELIRMVGAIEGWAGLDDELTEAYLDPIAKQIAQVLDQRDYVVYQFVRRYLVLLDYNASPTLGDCFDRLLLWPLPFQPAEIDLLLSQKAALLKGVTSATMRDRTNMIAAAHVHPDVIGRYLLAAPHRMNDMLALMHEVNYTTRTCFSLTRLDFRPLYNVIADMVDPNLTNLQRIACRDTCKRLALEFSAAEKAVEVFGSNEAKSMITRFMLTLKTAIDNFPAVVPAPTIVGMIANAISQVAATITDLRTAITNLPDAIAGTINFGNLTGSSDDDNARNLTNQLHSQGWLEHASFDVKRRMVNAMLSGSTDDDDEAAILKILEAAKGYDQSELYQLANSATWESLYTSFDGDEYDILEDTLNQPT
jgi:hypothetical protein